MNDTPVDVLQRKLEFLQVEEAKAIDSSAKFKLQEDIRETKRQLGELRAAASLALEEVLTRYKAKVAADWAAKWVEMETHKDFRDES